MATVTANKGRSWDCKLHTKVLRFTPKRTQIATVATKSIDELLEGKDGMNQYKAVNTEELKSILGIHCSPMRGRDGYVIGPDINGRLCHCSTHFTLAEARQKADELNSSTDKTETKQPITHAQYMANSSALFRDYYAQFITPETINFVKTRIGLGKLLKSNDPHFNDIIKHSRGGAGGWIWDSTPFNYELMRELADGWTPAMADRTCVGKVCALILVEQHKAEKGAK